MNTQAIKFRTTSRLNANQSAIIFLGNYSKGVNKSGSIQGVAAWLAKQLSEDVHNSLANISSAFNIKNIGFGEIKQLDNNTTVIFCGDKPLNELTLSKLAAPLDFVLSQTHASKVQIYCEGLVMDDSVLKDTKIKLAKDIKNQLDTKLKLNNAKQKDTITRPLTANSLEDYLYILGFISMAAADAVYKYDEFKNSTKKLLLPDDFIIVTSQPNLVKERLDELQGIIRGMQVAKDLANAPPNHCTPPFMAAQGKLLARQYKKISCKVLGEKELQKLKMNAYLAVTNASAYPPQLVIMEYKGAKAKTSPLVLVGKGMSFDSGGISIKPSLKMDEMKYDMCGAAAVFGTMKALAELDLPINLIGMAAAAENSVDAKSYRPGDIVRTMSGKTVEVLNTDAEGRLVLCDTLSYAARYKPYCVIDIATLTGACVIALGHLRSGMFANNDILACQVERAANITGDLVWRLPMDKIYLEDMKSNFADLANIGNRSAGTITAAGFLAEFAKDYPWVHLDIAGTAWREGAKKGATGRPVPLLTQFLISHYKNNG